MKTLTIIMIIVGVLLLAVHAYKFYKRFMLHKYLQQMCMRYNVAFRSHIYSCENWEMSDDGGIGWIEMNPMPGEDQLKYYIRYTGPLPEDEAIRILIQTFLNKNM